MKVERAWRVWDSKATNPANNYKGTFQLEANTVTARGERGVKERSDQYGQIETLSVPRKQPLSQWVTFNEKRKPESLSLFPSWPPLHLDFPSIHVWGLPTWHVGMVSWQYQFGGPHDNAPKPLSNIVVYNQIPTKKIAEHLRIKQRVFVCLSSAYLENSSFNRLHTWWVCCWWSMEV